MTTIAPYSCRTCALRFTVKAELDDHVAHDHALEEEAGPTLWGQVCVPVDPTHGPSPVLTIASVVARQAGMAVEVVAVPPRGLDQRTTEAHLRGRVREAGRAGATAVTSRSLEPGDVAQAVLDHVVGGATTMLCMESRARGPVAELTLGSVSEAVVRSASVPVLMVGPRAEPRGEGYATLIVAVDGSAPADAAVDVAADLAERLDADLFLVQVLAPGVADALPADVGESTHLRRVVDRLPASRTSYDVLHARNPVRAIVDLARRRPDALIVVGTHGRTGVRRMALGSVALGLVRHAPTPVLVVNGAVDNS